jgi:hypothetical protein
MWRGESGSDAPHVAKESSGFTGVKQFKKPHPKATVPIPKPSTPNYQWLSLFLINQRDLKTSVQAYIQAMLTSQLGEDKWSASRADHFN